MKVFVAGATGVLGSAVVPQLVARGHEVIGMTRSASKQDLLRGPARLRASQRPSGSAPVQLWPRHILRNLILL